MNQIFDESARRTRSARWELVRPAGAVASGLALAGAFPPWGLWPLSVVAVAGFMLVVRGCRARRAAGLGLVFGFVFFAALLGWLRVVGVDAWIVLSAVLSLYTAALGAGLAVVARLPGWPVWSACLWVAEEAVRDRFPLGGFTWGRLAFAQAGTPLAPYAALGGAPLVTFAVALVAGLLAWTLLHLRRRTVRPVAALAAAGAVALLGSALPLPSVPEADGRQVTVAVVQGNVPQLGLDFLGQRRAVLDNHVGQTRLLADQVAAGRLPRPDLVIWPENSSDIDPFTDPRAREAIDAAVRRLGIPVLVGAVIDGPDPAHVLNQGIVWNPIGGPVASYTKRHPVPFGEYIPLRAALTPYIGRLQRIPRDFQPGTAPGVLQMGTVRIGDVICFEVSYDHLVRDTVLAGAQLLVVQTNNATYGLTGQTEQQLAMSRLRAVEHGRAVLVAATSGISAIIAPDGRVVRQSAEFTPDLLVAAVPTRDALTVADRVGALPEWLVTIVGLVVCVFGVARSGRRTAGRHTIGSARLDGAPSELVLTTETRGKAGA